MGKITDQAGNEVTNIMLYPTKYKTTITTPLTSNAAITTTYSDLFKYTILTGTSKPYLTIRYSTDTTTDNIVVITEFDKEAGDTNQVFKVDNTGQVQVKTLSGNAIINQTLESTYAVPLFLTEITNKDTGKVLTFILPNVAETDGTENDDHGRQLKFNGNLVGNIQAIQLLSNGQGSSVSTDYTGHTLGTSNYMKYIQSGGAGNHYFTNHSVLDYDFFKNNQVFYAEVDFCMYRAPNSSDWTAFNFPGLSGVKTTIRFRVRNDKWEWIILKNWPKHGSDTFTRLAETKKWSEVPTLNDGGSVTDNMKIATLTNGTIKLEASLAQMPQHSNNLQMNAFTVNDPNGRLEHVCNSIKIFGINK